MAKTRARMTDKQLPHRTSSARSQDSRAAGRVSPAALRKRVSLAADRIAPYARETPLVHSEVLSRELDMEVWLKLEMLQDTGSFKFRGAMNRLLTLSPQERALGVVAASTGNHGAAVARAAAILDVRACVYAPKTADAQKLAVVRRLGAEVRQIGTDCLDAEAAARRDALETKRPFVSPYNDLEVMAGQGTLGLEVARQAGRFDAIVASVGGGGLIGGIGAALRGTRRRPEVIGVQPRASAVMAASVKAGRLLVLPSLPTLSDGTAGGVEEGSISFPICQAVVDRFVLVSEAAILRDFFTLVAKEHLLVEGAAACAVAGLRAEKSRLRGARVVVVLCGRNVSAHTLRDVLKQRGGK